ncbi:Endonuclease/exonuclease/phosphatase [Irpex rosettiformis]|uniref:Endonuclease/exonuclease/phosphatase n=1 Tax=Irpex rosettiformis TaxID=378272 RepID=A0ACB8UK49_9APHY|nr:Endonuclease/exonuclease/phosphatase [Irpex rosettiformis]
MPSQGYQLTPEQLALSEERKRLKILRKKEKEEQDGPTIMDDPRGKILDREWLRLDQTRRSPDSDCSSVRIKVMTWNLLAQTLVRRELFPVSDCLKGSQREHMLFNEILSHGADICCLQELDQKQKIFPVLDRAGYSYVFKAGPKKKHGSLIAFRKDIFTETFNHTIEYDLQTVRSQELEEADETPLGERAARGSSFFTKNIGNLVALKRNGTKKDGVIVATTHLFWHPRYTYERARQVGILFREVEYFRQTLDCSHWPCIVAGDFNFSPDDPAYSLLVGDPLLPEQLSLLLSSRVIHITIDPSIPHESVKDDEEGAEKTQDKEGEGEEQDPDRIIVNARPGRPEDGLLSDEELIQLFDRAPRPVSAYDEGLRLCDDSSEMSNVNVKEVTFGARLDLGGRRGAYEPIWTSYTHYWKTVLDYIFVLSPADRPVTVMGLAKPHPTAKLEPGIPMKGVCGSDHISLCAELSWPSLPS